MHTVVVNPQTLRFTRHPLPDLHRVPTLYALPLHPVLGRGNKPVLVPLLALAVPPLGGAQVAELVSATACHMVAPDREFHEMTAARASLPPGLGSQGNHSSVLRARASGRQSMRSRLAVATCVLPAGGAEEVYRGWGGRAEEGGTGGPLAVHPVLRPELERLPVELLLNFPVQIDMNLFELERLPTTGWWEKGLVDHGCPK